MPLKSHHFLEFGPFRVVPSEHLLLCEGTPVALTPRAFDLLMVLVQNSGHLVQKEELIRAVWQDSFVEEANLAVNISTLRKVLAEKSSGQQYIETFPRRGYRFNAKVEEVPESDIASPSARLSEATNGLQTAVATPAEPAQPVPAARQAEALRRKWRKQITIPAIVLLSMSFVIFVYFGYRSQVRERRLPQTPRSLAILPFQNLKQDPNNDFLGFSLADAIITRLSYVSALAVRPSSDVERYRGPSLDISKVAEELKVDTLLSGNFIREGDHVRITSQLIDVATDQILWTDTLDLKYENLMTIQDNVAQQIIKGLKLHLSAAETERLEIDKPIDPLAYEYYLRGIDLYAKNDFPMAIRMLEKSGEIEPSHALTWAHLGRSRTANASFEFGGREEYYKAQVAYERALSLQPLQMEARIYMANLFTDTGRVEKSVPLLREVLKTNPNHAEAHWELGYAYRFGGMLQESVSESELARRLDPEVKLNNSAQNSFLYLGQYGEFLQSLPKSGDTAFNIFYRGFAEYYQSDWDRAAKDLDRAFELDPSFLHAQVGKALSDAIRHQNAKGIELLYSAENKIKERGVGDPEAIYKIVQAYAALGEKTSALRMFRHSIESGFFCYPYFMTDPLLDILRHEVEFKRLIEVARRRHEAFKNAFF